MPREQTRAIAEGCVFGATDGPLRVALVGDSHAAHWFPALHAVTEERGWRLTAYTKSACAFVPIMLGRGEKNQKCLTWGQDLREKLRADPPDLIVFGQSANHFAYGSADKAESSRRIASALGELWQELSSLGIQIAAIRDTPFMPFSAPECLSKGGKCEARRASALPKSDPILIAARDVPAVAVLDFTDAICGPETCESVVGNVIVRRDREHFTATYARSVQTAFGAALDEVLERRNRLDQQHAEASKPPASRWSLGVRRAIDIDKPARIG